MLQARGRRHHLTGHVRQMPDGFHIPALRQNRFLRVEGAIRFSDLGVGPGGEGAQVHARTGWDGEGQQHAGDGGMHARHIYTVPQQSAHKHVGKQRVHMPPVHGNQHGKHHARSQQPSQRRALTVEDGDDQDGDDVVGDGERGEEHANAGRHAVTQKRQDAQRERDVGCRGNAPAAHGLRVGGVEHQIDGDGRQNTADGGHDGQQRLTDVGQLAHRELVFHFQAHQKEEHGHEHVVDHVRKRHLDDGFAEEDAHVRMPELKERPVCGGVGHDERHHGGKQHGTGGLRRRMRQLDELLIAMLVALHLFDIDTAVGHILPNLREAPTPPAKRSLLFHRARSVAKRAGGGSERPFPPFAIGALQAASRIRHSLSWRR